jgi:hypothetical protein
LFLVTHTVLRLMEDHPGTARVVLGLAPESVRGGFREIERYEHRPFPFAHRAALTLIGALTLLLCAATVVPLYLLARSCLPAQGAWAAAAFWPLVPSAVLFQPTADTAFPLLSTAALALAAWSARGRWPIALSFGAGLILAFGMIFSLAFLPVGLTVALVLALGAETSWRQRGLQILAVGAGFLALAVAVWALSGANPFVVWWWNRQNHARFYHAFSRNYLKWVIVNPVELAIGLGLPAAVWAVFGLSTRPALRPTFSALAVLALMSFGGLTLSEVGRLWLPWMPALLVASGAGLSRLQAGAGTLAAALLLTGVQTLLLEGMIQVVYPV